MGPRDSNGAEALPAGDFSTWLAGLRDAAGAEVPCDGCTACCTSSQFVHIEPDESETLARIPRELLFPAPGRPRSQGGPRLRREGLLPHVPGRRLFDL